MQLSKFFRVLVSPCGGYYAIFNELHPQPLYFRSDSIRVDQINICLLVEKFTEEKLRECNLVVDDSTDDNLFYEDIRRQVIAKISDPFILYLNLASGCNFNCTYCPVPGLAKEHGNHTLCSEHANQALLDWYTLRFEQGAQTNFLIFYGGEPLLNKPVFKSSLKYLNELYERVGKIGSLELMIVTNGALLDAETLSLCEQYRVTVVFGLDGLTVEENRTRLQDQDVVTHFAVLANISRAVKLGLRVAISLTLTPYNIDSLDNTVEGLVELGIKEIGFNFLKNASSISELCTPEKLFEFWKRSAIVAYRTAKRYSSVVSEFQYQKKLKAWFEKDFFPLDCTCLGNQVVIQGDGFVTNCPFRHREQHMSSEINQFLSDDTGLFDEFRSTHPLWNPAYVTLSEKAMCGQGCTMGMKQTGHEGYQPEIDWSSYFYSQEAFYDFLWNDTVVVDSVDV